METYSLYILSLIILFSLSIIIFRPKNKFLLKQHRKVNRFFKSKSENIRRRTISLLWWVIFVITIQKLIQTNPEQRLIITVIFIITILLLNRFEFAIYLILFVPFELIALLFSKLQKKERINKKGFKEKIDSIIRVRYITIIVYALILISSSYGYLITTNNFILFGFIHFLVILVYLFKALYDIFRSQKDLLYIADKLEALQRFIDEIERNIPIRNFVDASILLLNTIFSIRDKENSTIEKVINWSKNNLKKLQYVSKVGFSLFKTYLTIKLIFIVITTLLFFVIINANYLIQLKALGIITIDNKFYFEYALTSFYIFLGESLDNIIVNSSVDYFTFYLLGSGMIGWIITVVYIVLFFDIISISVNDFYESANRAIKKIVSELLSYFEKFDYNRPDLKKKIEIFMKTESKKVDDNQVNGIIDELK